MTSCKECWTIESKKGGFRTICTTDVAEKMMSRVHDNNKVSIWSHHVGSGACRLASGKWQVSATVPGAPCW